MTDMQDVDHTHPATDENFGDSFRRGPDVAADGGERDSEAQSNDTSPDGSVAENGATATMEEVDHTPTEGVSRSFERGTEGRSDVV